VGRLCEQKGQALLLQAMRRLIDQGVEARLILGGDGPMRPELEQRIEALGLGEAVSITGWISGDQVRQEMLRADVFVLPSFAEGLPVVLMEALALGRPAISTYVAGIPELIEPEVSGWLIPAGDVAALTWAMAQAARTPLEDRQRMGAAGRERVAQRHDVDQEAAKLLAGFRAAAQGEPMAETLDAESGGEPSDAPDRQREAAQ
jgi:glycosyltransferase involved in cell wall biosynthesis